MSAIIRTIVALLVPVLAQYAADALAGMQDTVAQPWPSLIALALSVLAAFKILPRRKPTGATVTALRREQATTPVPPAEPTRIADEAPPVESPTHHAPDLTAEELAEKHGSGA